MFKDSDNTPIINLAGHCDLYSNGCTRLSSDIQLSQAKGIEVMLSMGGRADRYYLTSSGEVQFYNNTPCQYSSGKGCKARKCKESRKQWISSIPAKRIFLGLPVAPDAVGSGFIPANVLISEILPTLKDSDSMEV
ncbi:unnamed protein product [Fraxinus pennsylvanica]|uniref:Uncharacterized protein n=1 Tax=Fraxinus pennsylvanica TaxID=56036 RepID=A0AAD2ACV1_9LAMI|nr:unnamed protein product [Fraxinus pennsylvanica]